MVTIGAKISVRNRVGEFSHLNSDSQWRYSNERPRAGENVLILWCVFRTSGQGAMHGLRHRNDGSHFSVVVVPIGKVKVR